MEVVHERCCGLDIHKKLIVACAMVPLEGRDGGGGGLLRRSDRLSQGGIRDPRARGLL
jgi:hypothetical protein